jgi:hypothetical protein
LPVKNCHLLDIAQKNRLAAELKTFYLCLLCSRKKVSVIPQGGKVRHKKWSTRKSFFCEKHLAKEKFPKKIFINSRERKKTFCSTCYFCLGKNV